MSKQDLIPPVLGGGVTTLNGESGAVTLTSTGTTITITPSGSTINLESSASGVAFNAITSGTNTTAAMVVGTGGSLAASGSGSITATVNANLTGPITSVGNATTISNSIALPGSPTTTTQSQNDNSTKISTTAYTDLAVANAVAGVNPAIAVNAATTAAGDTSGLTYANGASGIGATLTGTINTPITIDGVLLNTLGQRLLVKNDTQSPSGAFNGVYSLTVISTAGTAPVFTRGLDYDTPSDINNTGAIPVISGTVNGTTSWLLTSSVTTVGTSPLTYTQFTYGTSTVTLTGTQTLTNKRITKRVLNPAFSATPTINTDNYDVYRVTGMTGAITSMTTNLTGTPVDGDTFICMFTDNGTARAITWGTSFESSTVALPSTTVISTLLTVGLRWNVVTTKWTCVAVA